jgi:ADP-ribose pyrophosphatase YjhB (NUDIX family)
MGDTIKQYKNRDASKRICVRALCVHDDKILVVKRSNYGEKYIIMPGGGIDNDEDVLDAAMRETVEECSVTVSAAEVVKVFLEANGESEQHLVRCDYVSGIPHLDPSSEEYQRTDDGQNTY